MQIKVLNLYYFEGFLLHFLGMTDDAMIMYDKAIDINENSSIYTNKGEKTYLC